ncbi:MAG: ribosome silencing factor [Ignavibacteriales bacterium]|nr:ribosome silencing factor [Ignavibacteriales bacterium]
MNPEALSRKITSLIFEKKGFDVTLMEIYKVSTITDYFIVCTAASNTQVKAIADHIDHELRDEGIKVWHKEGYSTLSWVLLDYIDVVVHIFLPDTRSYYSLEKLWGDAPTTQLKDELE